MRALIAYIRESGWRHPIVVSKLSGYIVAGHARRLAALAIQCDAPVVYQDFDTEADELAFLLADNRLAELAIVDQRILDQELGYLDNLGFDLTLVGFDPPTSAPPIVDGKENLTGTDYGNVNSAKVPVLFLDIGASIERDLMERVRARLITDGASPEADNTEVITAFQERAAGEVP